MISTRRLASTSASAEIMGYQIVTAWSIVEVRSGVRTSEVSVRSKVLRPSHAALQDNVACPCE